jgi:hypothetical protein
MSKNREKVSKETAKVVATMMIPMVGLGLLCLSVGVYLMNSVFTGI